MQEIRSSNPPVITGICDPNKSRARHHRSLKLGSKLKNLSNIMSNSISDENREVETRLKVHYLFFSFHLGVNIFCLTVIAEGSHNVTSIILVNVRSS